MARGIDIPTVDWVVQYDPPTNVEAYVHRCGRTARMGNIGKALLFLLPSENAYIDFVRINQKVVIEEFLDGEELCGDDSYSMSHKIRKIACRDREVYEKGLRAFVSFIQSYIKHQCNIVLQLKELDLCKLAYGFGLLHLPRMPELRDADVSGFVAMDVDTKTIRYTDKVREKARIERLERETAAKELKETEENNNKQDKQHTKASDSWSKQKEQKQKKNHRKENKANNAKKRKLQQNGVDVDDFMAEGLLLKKLKRGKISKQEFEERVKKETSNKHSDIDSDSGSDMDATWYNV